MRPKRSDLNDLEIEKKLLGLIARLDKRYPLPTPSADARSMAEAILGSQVSDKTYQRWRFIANIRENARELTGGECVALWAIAFLKRDSIDKQVTRSDIIRLLQETDWLRRLERSVKSVEEKSVRGDQLAEVLGCSESWLYKVSKRDKRLQYKRGKLYDFVAVKAFRDRLHASR